MPGTVAWLTGLPASGKTTLARAVVRQLEQRGVAACLLDSDEVRASVFPHLGYGDADRSEFYSSLAQLAALLARQGLTVIVAATANRAAYREAARALAPRFVEVYVATPSDVCAERDVKGLYAGRAEAALPGRGARYEPPPHPDVVATGGRDREAVHRVADLCCSTS